MLSPTQATSVAFGAGVTGGSRGHVQLLASWYSHIKSKQLALSAVACCAHSATLTLEAPHAHGPGHRWGHDSHSNEHVSHLARSRKSRTPLSRIHRRVAACKRFANGTRWPLHQCLCEFGICRERGSSLRRLVPTVGVGVGSRVLRTAAHFKPMLAHR